MRYNPTGKSFKRLERLRQWLERLRRHVLAIESKPQHPNSTGRSTSLIVADLSALDWAVRWVAPLVNADDAARARAVLIEGGFIVNGGLVGNPGRLVDAMVRLQGVAREEAIAVCLRCEGDGIEPNGPQLLGDPMKCISCLGTGEGDQPADGSGPRPMCLAPMDAIPVDQRAGYCAITDASDEGGAPCRRACELGRQRSLAQAAPRRAGGAP